jgi:hypothetical protein
MIVTVTLNPADDVTYEVASMNPGDEHRDATPDNDSAKRPSLPNHASTPVDNRGEPDRRGC